MESDARVRLTELLGNPRGCGKSSTGTSDSILKNDIEWSVRLEGR